MVVEWHQPSTLGRPSNIIIPCRGNTVKIESPTFNGYLDMEAFLIWCSKVEDNLDMLEVPDMWKELSDEASKLRVVNLLVAREHTVVPTHVPHEFQVILKEFWDVLPDDFPDGLLPLRIQHLVDFIPRSSLPNCSYYYTSPPKHKALKEKIELLQKGFIIAGQPFSLS